MRDSGCFLQALELLIEKGIRVEVRSSNNPIKAIRANDKKGVEHLYIPSVRSVLLHGPFINGKLKIKELSGVSVGKFAFLLENPEEIEEIFKKG